MIEHLSTYHPWLTNGIILSLLAIGAVISLIFLWRDLHEGQPNR